MADPLLESVKAGVGGFKEALKLADNLEGAAQALSDLGKKDLAARAKERRKSVYVRGDYSFVEAVDEFYRVNDAKEFREKLRKDIVSTYGTRGWAEVEEIEARQHDEWKRLYTQDGLDRQKLFRLKVWCFVAAAFCTFFLWNAGMLPMEILKP